MKSFGPKAWVLPQPVLIIGTYDKDGVVLYQNERAIERDGDVTGKNLYNCHGKLPVCMREKQ